MEVRIIKHANQIFAKNKEGDLLKVNALVIKPKEGAPRVYDADSDLFKMACPEGTKHRAEYISAGMVNLY